jgi:hypothetical protein
MVVHPAIYSI